MRHEDRPPTSGKETSPREDAVARCGGRKAYDLLIARFEDEMSALAQELGFDPLEAGRKLSPADQFRVLSCFGRLMVGVGIGPDMTLAEYDKAREEMTGVIASPPKGGAKWRVRYRRKRGAVRRRR